MGGDPRGLTLGLAPIGPRRSMYAKQKIRQQKMCAVVRVRPSVSVHVRRIHNAVRTDILVMYGWPFVPHLAVFCDGMKTSTSVFETLTAMSETSTTVSETQRQCEIL